MFLVVLKHYQHPVMFIDTDPHAQRFNREIEG